MDIVSSAAWPPPPWEQLPDQPSASRPYVVDLPGTARRDEDAPTSRDAQAAAEGIVLDPDGDYLEFYGEKFRLADKVGLAPMIRFGAAANRGLDSDDMEGLAAMYSLIRSVIHRPPLIGDDGRQQVDANGKKLRDETQWNRFLEIAEDELADGDDIMAFVNRAMEVMAARPTKPREISSGGSRATSASSRAASSSQAMHPDMAGLTPVADLGR
jgi:hypothetical protein